MQINEHAGQIRQGSRPPDSGRSFDDERANAETRLKRPGADKPRREADRAPAHRPVRYGAGF